VFFHAAFWPLDKISGAIKSGVLGAGLGESLCGALRADLVFDGRSLPRLDPNLIGCRRRGRKI
jgi:hypothetical protein